MTFVVGKTYIAKHYLNASEWVLTCVGTNAIYVGTTSCIPKYIQWNPYK